MHFTGPPRLLKLRLTQLILGCTLLLGSIWLFTPASYAVRRVGVRIPVLDRVLHPPAADHRPPEHPPHPIDHLIANAANDFETTLGKQTHTVQGAADAYRARRGRQPPPRFDEWFAYAKSKNAIIVEDFFDQIYHDLGPFWAIVPKVLRTQARGFLFRISVRNGTETHRSDEERPWMQLWGAAVAAIAKNLPDLDMPINVMDESRMVVPWEEIDTYMAKQAKSRKIVDQSALRTTYSSLDPLPIDDPVEFAPTFDSRGPYWQKYVVGCNPDSLARHHTAVTDFDNPPELNTTWPADSYHGYVQNWTLAKSPCFQPHLRALHGTFIEPVSIKHTAELFPFFGGSKLPMNNEILLPPAMYFSDMPMYSGGAQHGGDWDKKRDGLVWRGVASGGRNKAENWRHFQRHRFIAMLNSSAVQDVEAGYEPLNFVLPDPGTYNLSRPLAPWLSEFADAAITELLCFPNAGPGVRTCSYTSPYFAIAKNMPMKQQYDYKYLPDIDGNSFSGRYRAFLLSTSLPIKATIYAEWHDSRLWPWKHFVPMDNTFIDLYGILQYFLGDGGKRNNDDKDKNNKRKDTNGHGMTNMGHDAVGRKIADDGKAWAEKVLRKEDMHIYMYRLLLEYARICDDDREHMGWAG